METKFAAILRSLCMSTNYKVIVDYIMGAFSKGYLSDTTYSTTLRSPAFELPFTRCLKLAVSLPFLTVEIKVSLQRSTVIDLG